MRVIKYNEVERMNVERLVKMAHKAESGGNKGEETIT